MIELRETFQAWLQQRKDQVVNLDSYSPKPLQCRKIPIYYDDDDDEESSTPLRDIIIFEHFLCIAITLVLSIKEPKDSFIMGDDHLDTILEKESDEFIKSSVENLVPNPSESKDLSNVGSECNVPVCNDFITFPNLLFDADDNFSSSDDKSFSNEDIDSLLNEFAGELIFLKSIPPGIDEADCDPEEEIRLIEKLLILTLLWKRSIYLLLRNLMPPGIENDDDDSEGDILILEELLTNDFLSLPENESFHYDIPSITRPPAKPPDDDEIEPNSGILTVKVVGDISEHYVLMPRLLPTHPTLTSNQEKSPHLLSHRGLKAFQLSSKSPMMIYAGNIPILDVPFLYFYPP
nr:hypothetical protein [Tanacetum cinerariifolium]